MDYFIMQTDQRLRRLPELRVPRELVTAGKNGLEINKENPVSILYVKGNISLGIEYPDYIAGQIPLIAEKLQRILQKYQQDTVFHQVVLIEKETGEQKPYYRMLPPAIACEDQRRTVYDQAGNIQDFVLDVERVGKRKMFRIQELKNQIAVRLDVAESILRRDTNGIWFEPLKQ